MASDEPLVNAIHPDILPKLDPQFAEIYTKYQAPHLRADQVTYEQYDANRSKYTFRIAAGPYPPVASNEIYQVPVTNPPGSIAVQIYIPTPAAIKAGGLQTPDGKLPAHLNYHGGGFVIGGLATDESWCRQACQDIGCIILNIDYRMAPAFPHPVPITDSWAALKWAMSSAAALGIDASRVSVGGLSAGGQIAAVLALLARDEPGMPKLVLQVLVVPVIDVRFVPVEGAADKVVCPYESYFECEFAPCLPLHRLSWFYNLWLPGDVEKRKEAANHFLASPIVASSHSGLAPASFHVAEIDPLRCEAVAYHENLKKAGTESNLKIYKGVCHPFGGWDGQLEVAKEYVRDTKEALKRAYKL